MIAALLLVVCLLSGFASAVPKPRDVPNKSFSLRVADSKHGKRDFVRDWAAAHQKWGSGVPVDAISAYSLADSEGRVVIQPMGTDALFIADIHIGTPPQLLKMALDTGSADMWVQSSDTEYNVNEDGPWAPRYKPNASETAHFQEGAEWRVGYVDGTAAEGIVYSDTVRLGKFEIKNATVQSAKTIAAQFERETGLTGILGLAKNLPSNIEPPTPSFLDQLRPQLERPVFTADLRRNASGRFDFGYVNEDLAAEPLTWLETVPDSRHWDIRLDLTAWTGSDNTWWYHEFVATVDTGTTLLFLPDVITSMYWFNIPGMRVDPRLSNAYTFPCNVAKNLPDLMFKLPGTEHVLTVPGPYLNYGPIDSEPTQCWGGMQSAEGLDTIILGDVMLKAMLVAFDLETNKVGLANKVLHDM